MCLGDDKEIYLGQTLWVLSPTPLPPVGIFEVNGHVTLAEHRAAKAAEDPLVGPNLLPEALVVDTCPPAANLTVLERFAAICMALVTPFSTRRALDALMSVNIQQLFRAQGPAAVWAWKLKK